MASTVTVVPDRPCELPKGSRRVALHLKRYSVLGKVGDTGYVDKNRKFVSFSDKSGNFCIDPNRSNLFPVWLPSKSPGGAKCLLFNPHNATARLYNECLYGTFHCNQNVVPVSVDSGVWKVRSEVDADTQTTTVYVEPVSQEMSLYETGQPLIKLCVENATAPTPTKRKHPSSTASPRRCTRPRLQALITTLRKTLDKLEEELANEIEPTIYDVVDNLVNTLSVVDEDE